MGLPEGRGRLVNREDPPPGLTGGTAAFKVYFNPWRAGRKGKIPVCLQRRAGGPGLTGRGDTMIFGKERGYWKKTIGNNRMAYPDILRIISAFAVVVLHVSAQGMYVFDSMSGGYMTSGIYHMLTRFAVPVFIMLSGMFFLDPKKDIPIKKIYTKHIPRLVIPLVFWGVFYYFVEKIANRVPVGICELPDALYGLAATGGFQILWFIYVLIGLYIAAPVLRVLTAKAGRKVIEYFLIIGFVFTSVIRTLSLVPGVDIFNYAGTRLNMLVVSVYVLYFVLGYYLRHYDIGKTAGRVIYISGAAGLASTVLGTLAIQRYDPSLYYFLLEPEAPNIVLFSMALFLFFKNRFSHRQFKRGRCAWWAFCKWELWHIPDTLRVHIRFPEARPQCLLV